MNAIRASESQALRQEVAQLLRRLRAIRRDRTARGDQAARIQRELSKAGRVSLFITFRERGAGEDAVAVVDHDKLRAASADRDTPALVTEAADRV